MEALRATGQSEEHDPMRRVCEATRVVCEFHSVQTPPGHDPFSILHLQCAELTAAFLHIYALSSCVKGGVEGWRGEGLSRGGESVWRRPLDALFVVTSMRHRPVITALYSLGIYLIFYIKQN